MKCGLRGCIAAVLALAWLGCSADEPTASPALDFTLPDLQGKPIRLSDYHGKTVIIDFWATWCPPCIFQIPELNKLAAAHREKGDVVVIGVSVDADGPAVVAPWVEEHSVVYTIVCGDEELAAEFGVFGFPTLVIIDPEGELASRHVGLLEYDTLEELVAGLTSP
jgi:thiol-disulfide isomerase/thioredoxin